MNEAFKVTLVLVSLTLLAAPSRGADDKIRKAVEQGLVTGEFLKTLTEDDVPEDWKAHMKTESKETRTQLVFSRRGVRRLALLWSNDWKGDKEKMFVGTIYHGDQRLLKIAHIGESTAVYLTDAPKGYQVITSIKDDGTTIVTVTDDKKFVEGIVLKGRETHLLDDLEYTKSVLAMEHIAKPIIGALVDSIEGKPKKKSAKTKMTATPPTP